MDAPGIAVQSVAPVHVRKRPRTASSQLNHLSAAHPLCPKRGKGHRSMNESAWVHGNSEVPSMVALAQGQGVTVVAGIFDSPSSTAPPEEVRKPFGHQSGGWEPTIHTHPPVVGVVQMTAGAAPNLNLASVNHFSFPPLFNPAPIDVLANLSHQPSQYWTSSSTPDLAHPMPHQSIYTTYGHDASRVGSEENVLYSPDPPSNADGFYLPPDVSNAFMDPSFPMLEGSPYLLDGMTQYDSSAAAPVANMDDLELNWQIIQHEQSVDDVEQTGSGGESSGSISPTSGLWQKVPSFTDDPVEVSGGRAASLNPSPRGARSPKKHNRRQLKPEEREQTGRTRQIGACVRCQMQRCLPNPNPELAERGICKTCSVVAIESKKVIHRLPCRRGKLTETILFRTGGLGLTKRWDGAAMKDLGREDWASDKTHTIEMSLGLCDAPVVLEVRKFRPLQGDVTARSWRDRNGVSMKTEIEPYALADIYKTAHEFRSYVSNNAYHAVRRYAENATVDQLVRRTYMAAWNYMTTVTFTSNGVDAHLFMANLFRLWFATRNTMGSSSIVGEDKLGMIPDPHPDYPYPGKISVPRMVCQQFDSIHYNYSLKPLRDEVLKDLWKLIQGKDPQCFFMIYLTVFILLHEASATSKDRRRHAIDNSAPFRYTIPGFVEELQEGTNIILMFWHYYKRGLDPVIIDWDDVRSRPGKNIVYRDLTPMQIGLMSELREVSKMNGSVRHHGATEDMTWEHDLYFVAQMFEDGWQPKKTWTRF